MNKPSLAFPKEHRLLSSDQFKRVFQNPKAIRRTAWIILGVRNEFDHPRLGLVVSKKNAPKAVQRNLIKRMVREVFRHHHRHLPNWDVIVLPKHKVLSMDNFSALQQLKKALYSLKTLEKEY